MMPAASLIPERILHLTWVLVGLKIYSVVDGQVLVTLGCENIRGKGVRETMTRCHPHQPEDLLKTSTCTKPGFLACVQERISGQATVEAC